MSTHRRKWLGWAAFGCVLVGLGFALDAWLPPSPRFVLRDPNVQRFFGEVTLSGDGKTLATGTLVRDAKGDNWVCGSLRTRDTVTGREKGDFFRGLAGVCLPGFGRHEVIFSPDRSCCALLHRRGLAVANLHSGSEWSPIVWKKSQGPDMEMYPEINKLLLQNIDVGGLHQPVKLKAAIEYVLGKSGVGLPIQLDQKAFTFELGDAAPDPSEEHVSLPPVPRRMPASNALNLISAKIANGKGKYAIRRNVIEITTQRRYLETQVWPPVFSPRGTFVVLAEGRHQETKIHVVDCATGTLRASLSAHWEAYRNFGFTPDDALLYFFATEKGKPLFTVWNTRTNQAERTFEDIDLPSADYHQFAPDGRTMLIRTDPIDAGAAELIDLSTGQKRRCFDVGGAPGALDRPQLRYFFLFSPDNRTLVRTSDQELQIWDIPAGKKRATIKLDEVPAGQEVFIAADSRVIVTADNEHGFSAWSLDTGERLWPRKDGVPTNGLELQKGLIEYFDFPYPRTTPDSRLLVVCGDGRVDLLDPLTGAPSTSLIYGEKFRRASNVKFTPDGRLMLSEWILKEGHEPWLLKKWLGEWWPFEPQEPMDHVVVTEVATGHIVLRINARDSFHELCDDGGTLMSYSHNDYENPPVICCWDVPCRPARSLVVGIPLAAAGAAIMIRWRLARKQRPTPPGRELMPPQIPHGSKIV